MMKFLPLPFRIISIAVVSPEIPAPMIRTSARLVFRPYSMVGMGFGSVILKSSKLAEINRSTEGYRLNEQESEERGISKHSSKEINQRTER